MKRLAGALHVTQSANRRDACRAAALLLAACAPWLVASGAERPAILETEVSDVATLGPPGPHRLLITSGMQGGVKVVNGDSGKVEGQVHTAPGANLAIDPNNKFYYIAESMWSRMNRGKREDLVSIYDDQLKLVAEILVPGRLISVPKSPSFDISADGRLGYVFDMHPASSVVAVDLVGRKVAGVVETPGCGMIYPSGNSRFASLCADGTLATVVRRGSKFAVTHSARFFDPENDPVFEESVVDRQSGQAYFISYTGMVYPVLLGDSPTFDKPWSLQEAAGLPAPSTEPEHLAWRPGGGRIAALHKATGRLFVLMHAGTHWSHKDEGTHVWVMDTKTRKRIARFKLDEAAALLAVTQDAEPLLFASGSGFAPGGALKVINPQNGAVLRAVPGATGSIAAVSGF
jgi:methylamine dehydrogenase heavy chain